MCPGAVGLPCLQLVGDTATSGINSTATRQAWFSSFFMPDGCNMINDDLTIAIPGGDKTEPKICAMAPREESELVSDKDLGAWLHPGLIYYTGELHWRQPLSKKRSNEGFRRFSESSEIVRKSRDEEQTSAWSAYIYVLRAPTPVLPLSLNFGR